MSFFSSHSLSGSSNPQEISTKGHVLNQTLILIFAVILLSSGWEYFLSKKNPIQKYWKNMYQRNYGVAANNLTKDNLKPQCSY